MLLLLLMWPLMWKHDVYGKALTHDKDLNTESPSHGGYATTGDYKDVYDDDSDVDVFNGQDADENSSNRAANLTTNGPEGSNVNETIYGRSGENDNNSNKLQQNVAYQGRKAAQQIEMTTMTVEDIKQQTLPMKPTENQLNAKDTKIIPNDIKDTGCKAHNEGRNNWKGAKSDCDAQVNYESINDMSMTEEQSDTGTNGSDLTPILQKALIQQFSIKHKQIRRVNLFTCREEYPFGETADGYKRQNEINMQSFKLLHGLYSERYSDLLKLKRNTNDSEKNSANLNNLLIKVIEIDQFSVSRHPLTYKGSQRGSFRNGGRILNAATSPNWLEKVLGVANYPQVVVVNLGCGNASRRLLEMASSKALFNSMFHWLLVEDSVSIRQIEEDDPDGIKNQIKCSVADKDGGRSGSTSSSQQSYDSIDSNSSSNTNKEVVNDSYKPSMKKISFAAADVVSASTSDSGKKYKNQLLSASSAAVSAVARKRAKPNEGEGTDSELDKSISDAGGVADEDDKEIIEKFLEELNININSEIILAKQRKRCISTSFAAADSPSSAAPLSVTNVSITMVQPSMANFASSGSVDYGTFQRMDYYTLYDVWSPGRQYGGQLNVSEVGEFSLQQGLWFDDWYVDTGTVRRRLNMHLAKIRCLVVVTHKNGSDSLHDYLTSHYDTHLDSMNRFNFALLSHVRDLFNFSFVLAKTSTWGYLKNGKFDGMIGALVRKQADIGGSPIFFRIERAKVIDYTTRTWVARPCFIFRHPRSTKKDRIVFLQPFSNSVWVLLAVCGTVTILLLWALRAFEPLELKSNYAAKHLKELKITSKTLEEIDCKRRVIRWCGPLCGHDVRDITRKQRAGMFVESFLFYIGSICQQGLSFTTRSFAGRCVVIISLLFSFAIYQFYSASIVGTLLMEKPKTIRTLKDLIHSALEIGIEDIVYNRDYFLRTKDPVAQELYAKKVTAVPDTGFGDTPPDIPNFVTQESLTEAQKAKSYRDILHSHETGAHAKTNEASNWYEPENGVAKIKNGRFAFHVDVATAYKIIADTFTEKEICELTEIQLFPPQKMVSIVQKGSPLRKVITYGLRRVSEVGLTDYERKVWHSPKPRCVKQLHTDDLQVDIQTFTSALLVLIFGIVVSLMILAMEILNQRVWQQYGVSLTKA